MGLDVYSWTFADQEVENYGDKIFNNIIDSIINNASDDEIEIIREKLNNHLINRIYGTNIHEELLENYLKKYFHEMYVGKI